MDNKKLSALKSTIDAIEKEHGKGSIILLGEKAGKIEHLPTGLLQLDKAIGIGGLPKGRIIEIVGQEAVGKTLIASSLIAETQANGGVCALVDAEHAFDPNFAKLNGVKVDDLFVSQPDNGEAALDITEKLICSNAVDVVVVDSVAALVPKAEIEGAMGEAQMGLQARLMSQAMRKLAALISKSKCTVVFINQYRKKLGLVFGNPNVPTGGEALKFYASIRMEVSRKGNPEYNMSDGSKQKGLQSNIKIIKNKVAAPFKECLFEVVPGIGLDKIGGVLDVAIELGKIKQSGAWFYFGEQKLGQGKDAAKGFLLSNVDVRSKMIEEIRKELFS